jgi:DNA-binding transcriptional ArsR family regulator
MLIAEYVVGMARAATTSDVFNAVADVHRREILDVLIIGEKAVGAIGDLSMSQPQVSQHLRVLGEVGVVRAGRRAAAGCTAWIPSPFGPCTTG